MKNNLLSIVIPAYNVDNYLENSVKSLGNFLFDTRVEIIILNDGSTDRTLKIANHLKNIYCNITVIDKKNGGLSDTRNLGNSIATGKYIYFFDADDYLNDDKISDVLDLLENKDLDLLCFGYSKVSEAGDMLSKHTLNSDIFIKNLSSLEFIKLLLSGGNEPIAGYLPTKIIKHSLVKQMKFMQMNYEDMPFVLEFVLKYSGLKIVYMDSVVYNYVQRNKSITHSSSEKNMIDKLFSLQLVRKLIAEYRLPNDIIVLNNKRSVVAALWASSINKRRLNSAAVAIAANKQFNFTFLFSEPCSNLYLKIKMLYYFFYNKNIIRSN
ncbi:polysaccharide biosynthesis protein [Paucilactobacillus hokkaidonensis JCM 18461]|uniref:Polysaccharide biosynthesis protein n=2 Tax=Paucilactobacillus hokkaidonensis TaxID=1193095 RepID=A0A0A1GR95_9LACO|nr:glycosyltransferase family 2 protein [Paucilactobacillus hokkaidonensis]KRO08802.1 hypothetical protein IV59_GL001142 [Paucilactobacillus hokkaidonensis]BAP84822.1 polysaccharide biosynthesis protein [Paucilactobacillus hokkaidonensis JCM 18461]